MGSESEDRVWVGVDVGGTKTLACVYSRKFRLLAEKRRKTRNTKNPDEPPLERLAETIREALDDAQIAPSRIGSIGLGMAGMLDLDAGVLLHSPNLGWRDMPFASALRKEFKAPVLLANDVDAGAYGEYRFGAAQGARCVVGVFPGTGIGGACIYEGRIIRGRTGSCMEIGHIPVAPDGPLCGCGLRGCLESVASRLAIASEAAAAACRGEAPNLLKAAGTSVADIRSGELLAAIRAGDKTVERIVRRAARRLGLALAGVVHLLAPDVVLLGGGLVEEMPDLYLDEVEKAVRDHAIKSFTKDLRFRAAELGDYAVALGAAALAAEAAAPR